MTALIPLEGATATGLTLPTDLPYEEWCSTIHAVARLGKAAPWWIGDCLLHGEAHFGELFAQAASETGYSEESLRGFLWVSSRIAPHLRHPKLSWSHHQVVAGSDQCASYLDLAEEKGWTIRELREAVKGPPKPKAVCGAIDCPMRLDV